MPAPAFSSGTSLNIPCYITTAVTISLSSYINTEANGIDQGEIITSKFEWTLPSGWQTTSGQTGTFVSSSSISVIPPASSSSTSISVRAKANTQYSQPTTLQITRNLNDFSISGQPNVVYNTTYRYEVPSIPNATYTWQLPTGWSGNSTTNYIDATVGCSSGNIIATINVVMDQKLLLNLYLNQLFHKELLYQAPILRALRELNFQCLVWFPAQILHGMQVQISH